MEGETNPSFNVHMVLQGLDIDLHVVVTLDSFV